MNRDFIRQAGWVSLAGMAVQMVGTAWAIHLWNQSHAEAYSFLRNFVSELGAPKNSPMAMVFHCTIILSSLLAVANVYALGGLLRGRLGFAAMGFGFLSTLGVVGVAIFPMDVSFLMPHLVFALIFFWGWLLTVFLFTAALWRKVSFRGAPALILSGIAVWIVTGFFLWILMRALGGFLASGGGGDAQGVLGAPIKEPAAFVRPPIWDIAILEWCVVAATSLWNFSASHYLLRSGRSSPKSSFSAAELSQT